ncbi:pre-mRNA-splicing factor prp46 [Hypoxylon texense]
MSPIHLLDLSDDDQAASLGHPTLSTNVDGLSPCLNFIDAFDGFGNSSTTSAVHDLIGDAYQTSYPPTHVGIPNVQVIRAEARAYFPASPLTYPGPPPSVILRDLPSGTRSSSPRNSTQSQANFIISHTPEMADGIIDVVYKELARANGGDGKVEFRQTDGGSYVKIMVPAKNITELVEAARSVAEDLIADNSTERPSIFQEPPVGVDKKDFRILLEIDPLTNSGRPKLQLGNDALTNPKLPEEFQDYTKRLNEYVYEGLKTAGRLPLSLTLRAHLGHYMLRTYPRGKEVYEYGDFHAMIKNPRASGWLKTRIGDEALARRFLDFARNDTTGLFQPASNQSTLAAEVLPEYTFEVHSQRAKFYTPLKSRTGMATKGVDMRGTVACHPYRVITCSADASFPELNIVNLSVGKKLDWKFEAVNEEKGGKTFPDVVKYLRSLEFDLNISGEPHDLDIYPRLQPNNGTDYKSAAAKLKDTAMKTVYNFRWKSTSYVVQIAINHRWDSVDAINERQPTVDIGMSVFGEYWDVEEDAAGNIWGDELEFLLEDEDEDGSIVTGTDRVGSFLQVIRDVRDTVDSFF